VSTRLKRPLEVNLEFPVRTYDIDFAGVVSNIVYIRWLEDLRLTILERYYPLEILLSEGLAPTLVETRIRYQRPVRITDKVSGRMWINKLTRMKLIFTSEIFVNDEVAVSAEQLGCLIDMRTGRPAPMPEALRNKFRESDS
jgi:acyl-CoA thioester hydrolase